MPQAGSRTRVCRVCRETPAPSAAAPLQVAGGALQLSAVACTLRQSSRSGSMMVGSDQALDIGARRVVRAEAFALGGVERLLQQRAEDRGLDLFPVWPAACRKFADFFAVERQRRRVSEELAVEAFHLGFDSEARTRRGSSPPRAGRPCGENSPACLAASSTALKGPPAAGFDVLREHREQAAHKEMRDLFAGSLLRSPAPSRRARGVLQSRASPPRGLLRRIERRAGRSR